jgi:glucose-6-phosphate isomerase
MTNLEQVSGLPIAIDDDYKLRFHQPLRPVEPTARTYKEMQAVLMDPNAPASRDELYYMYRNVHFPDHDALLQKIGLTYDITVLPPGMLGREYNKTVGHYHASQAGSVLAYPEIYQVLSGRAMFFLQKMDERFENLIRVLAIEAQAGDKVIYPPNYGHIIVNTTDEVLVTANWVANDFKRMYKEVSDRRGMAYYVVKGERGPEFVPNPDYVNHPKVETLTNKFMGAFPVMKPGSMYLSGTAQPEILEFLTNPQKYAVELSAITS